LQLPVHKLIIYRKLLDDELVKKVIQLQNCACHDAFSAGNIYYFIYSRLIEFAAEHRISGNIWHNYVVYLLLNDENAFSLYCEQCKQTPEQNLLTLVEHDLEIIRSLFHLDWNLIANKLNLEIPIMDQQFINTARLSISRTPYLKAVEKLLEDLASPNLAINNIALHLVNIYATIGCGILCRYSAFRWDKCLTGIMEPDPINFTEIIGYQEQKEKLIDNTAAFLQGKPANNILLYGEKGTGKSSCVKALLNHYSNDGLRMIELKKTQLDNLGQVSDFIKYRGLRFIIFIDDLSFEDFETDYKFIKSAIEGSLEAIPRNVLLYVTSNRRHLIKENWADRTNKSEEVHISDSYQEKLSLVDRFGILITFPSPDQDQYLYMVEEMAKKQSLSIDRAELRKLAIQWELSYHGRSGRTAAQFIRYLSSKS